MHAVLASIGTDGDILPFIGVGAALRRRGHRVTVVAAEHYADRVAAHGLEFRQLVSTAKMRELLGVAEFWHPIKTARHTAKWGASLIPAQYELFAELCREPDVVLVTNPAILAANVAADKTGRRLATIILQPWMIPSAIAPPVMPIIGLPASAPRFLHALFYRLVGIAADVLFGTTLNRFRRAQGLNPMRRIIYNWLSPQLTIGMFPDWFGAPQNDWPPQIKLTGFPIFDAAVTRALPEGVETFLKAGKPTIVFTFGSGMMHAQQLFAAAPAICERLGAQGLVITRHHQPAAAPNIFHAPFIPFAEVFPRCAAVVHHGGVGTMAEAFAAGSPQLILPLGFDQLDNGVRVQKLGGGLHTASKHGVLSQKSSLRDRDISEITGKLRDLLSGRFREGCAALREKMREGNALEESATLVEALAGRKSL